MFLSIEYIGMSYSWKLQSAVIIMLAMISYYLFGIWWRKYWTFCEDMVVISLIPLHHTVHGLWHINLALYLSLDELIKGIISNWCQRLFKNNSYWEDMRRVLESSNSFLHHKIDWKNCEMDWSLISSTKIIFSYIIRFWAFPTEYKREASFSYSLLCYIYTNWKCIISSLIIIDFSFKLLLFYAYLLWIMTHTQWNK